MARPPKRVDHAKQMRQNAVPAETLLWKALRNRALGGFKFRRQHPIGTYVVDFACVECKVLVEADGESHLTRAAADQQRTRFLISEGWSVLRFWNTQIYDELDAVKEAIYAECLRRARPKEPPSPLPLSPRPSPS